jgi:hypothetical protein
MTLLTLKISQLHADDRVQPRESLSADALALYQERYELGLEMDPLLACFDGETYWLYSGFTRRLAALAAGLEELPVEVIPGAYEDARRLARQQNRSNTAQRTLADMRRAVRMAIEDRPAATDQEIIDECGVHHRTVLYVRQILCEALVAAAQGPLDEDALREEARARFGAGPAVFNPCFERARAARADSRARARAGVAEIDAFADFPDEEEEPEPAPPTPPGPRPAGAPAPPKKAPPRRPEKPVLRDGVGAVIPDHLRDVFVSTALDELYTKVAMRVEGLDRKAVCRAARPLASAYPFLREADLAANLKDAEMALGLALDCVAQAKPFVVCPECGGGADADPSEPPCEPCRGCGWLPRWKLTDLESRRA